MPNRILVDTEEGIPVPEWISKVEPFFLKAMDRAGYDGQEVSILFCSDEFIRKLNSDYRNIDSPTDVLSFENGGTYCDDDGTEWLEAGDIAVSLETLPKNAEYFDVDCNDELKRLLVHGMLHLNGFDHGEEHVEKGVEPLCEMLRIQKEILDSLESEKIIG